MNKTLIIAEAGVNHNGNLELAKKLIDIAAASGVDYVKFQTFKAEKLVAKDVKKAAYQIKNTNNSDSQYKMLKDLELDIVAHHILIDYCNSKNVKFLSTGFDLESLDLLNELNIDIFKVPSGEITNLPYLKKIASFGKPVILSTGMCTMQEVKAALDVMINNGISKENITILHCNTDYPTNINDVNLSAMLTMQKELDISVGYSDHTLGIEVPIASVAMGAICIEKHFTIDRTMNGPDHKASIEPNELNAMVNAIRNIEKAIGNGVKKPSKSEKKNIDVVRKSIFLNTDLEKGEIIENKKLIAKRPGSGISPMEWDNIVGKKTTKKLVKGEMLTLNDFK